METKQLLVTSLISGSPSTVWAYYNEPEHIVNWNAAHESWSCLKAENDMREGGRFLYRMEAKDGSFGFDFSGIYSIVRPFDELIYTLDDGRKVEVKFFSYESKQTQVVVTFQPERTNSFELQQQGWQAILDNFRKYVDTIESSQK